jgi:hypothetical protein
LKVLEGETQESINSQLKLFHERALPDLANNIKCGNSLIGSDFYKGKQPDLFNEEETTRVNAFDWEDEFPEVFRVREKPVGKDKGKAFTTENTKDTEKEDSHGEEERTGGFDVVIGNPPYLGGREWKQEGGRRYEYFINCFAVAEYQFDIYSLFLEKGVRLTRDGGLMGFITPNTWLNNKSNSKLRKFLLETASFISIVDYSRVQVFSKAIVLPIVTILKKFHDPCLLTEIWEPAQGTLLLAHRIGQQVWMRDELNIINIALDSSDVALRDKIEANKIALGSIADVKFGIKLYETGKGTPPQRDSDAKNHVFEADTKIDSSYRQYLEGKDIQRYQTTWKHRWLKYGPNLAAPRDASLFEGSRLLFRRIVGERLIGTFTDEPYVTSQLLQIVKPANPASAYVLLGILNSSLMAYYFRKKYNRQDKTFPEIRIYELASLPLPTFDSLGNVMTSYQEPIASLVDQMLSLHKRLQAARTEQDKTLLQRQIAATDKEIDRLVYDLYGLTEDEIAIVESSK